MFLQELASDTTVTSVIETFTQLSTSIIVLVLGFITTFVMTWARRAVVALDTAPSFVRSAAALVVGQALTWVSTLLGVSVTTDVTSLDTALAGLVVAAAGMGIHAVFKALGFDDNSPDTEN